MQFRRVTFITPDYPPVSGGAAAFHEMIMERFVDNGLTGEVMLDTIVGSAPAQAGTVLVTRRRLLASWRGIPASLMLWAKTLIMCARFPRTFWITGNIYPYGVGLLIASWLLGIRYAIVVHGMDILGTDARPKRALLVRNILRRCTFVIVNSTFTADVVIERGAPAKKVHTVHPRARIMPSMVTPQARDFLMAQYGVRSTDIIIVCPGRLVSRKQHACVMRACDMLASEFPTIRCWVVGTGPEAATLHALVHELHHPDMVEFFEPNDALMAGLYSCATCIALPARQSGADVEGFGIVFLEAAQARVPAIGGRSGGIVDAIMDGVTGYLVDPDSMDELMDALRVYCAHSEIRRAHGEAAYAYAQKLQRESCERLQALADIIKAL